MPNSVSLRRDRRDHRSWPRFTPTRPAFCRVTDPRSEDRSEAGLWNVSAGGVCVLLETGYLPGNRLTLEVRTPDDEDGEVKWVAVRYALLCPSYQEMWLTGCAFEEPVAADELRCWL
jgi:hypothetical protein